ncbi:hypothetical protein EV121DRAFT_206481 [Schizophyllum commune]
MTVWPDKGEGAPIPPVALAMTNWIEAAFYGIYTALFFQYIINRFEYGIGSAVPGKARPSQVYFVVTVLMYINGTAYSALSVYVNTTLTNFEAVHTVTPATGKASLAAGILTYIQLWLGDLLIVYRAHLVWDHDWRVTAVPWLTLLAAFILLFTAATFQDTRQVSAALFLAVAQNVITSGLLVYRLVSQHTESSRAGLHRFSRQSGTLIRMAYIISESAAMYLVVLVIYTILFQLKHSAVIYLQVMLSSVAGIVLLAISVRFAGMKTGSAGGPSMTWQPPSEWRISVQFAPAAADSRSAHEETVDEEGERCIEMQHPSFNTKEDSKRSSPISPPSATGIRAAAHPSRNGGTPDHSGLLGDGGTVNIPSTGPFPHKQSFIAAQLNLQQFLCVTTMAALSGAGGGGTVTPAATLLLASWIEVHFVVTILMYLNGTACSILSIFKTLGKLKAIDGHPDASAGKEAEFAASLMTFAQVVLGDFLTDSHGMERGLACIRSPLAYVLSELRCVRASLSLAVAQNILTTGLVVYRLGMQHSESSRANLHRFSKRNGALIRIAYIISESAAVYLAALVLYTVFYHLKHPGLIYIVFCFLLRHASGIVLLMISVRVAGMKSGPAGAGGPSMTWATPTEWRISVQFAPPVDSSGSAHEETQAEGGPYEAEIQLPRAGSKEDTK